MARGAAHKISPCYKPANSLIATRLFQSLAAKEVDQHQLT